jgi:hypothetical protein
MNFKGRQGSHFFQLPNQNERIKILLRIRVTFTAKIFFMSYELTGKLIAKYDEMQKSATFKTREFVVEKTDDIGGRTVTNYAKFQCVQDKTTIVDRVNVGDEIKVHFNIKGTKWEKDGKLSYFTNLDAWRIEQVLKPGADKPAADSEYLEPLDTFSATPPDAIDDLPF